MATASRATALELLAALERERARSPALRCGCAAVDALLGGGLRAGLVTEVCGEASAGKTQLALQLLLRCRLPVALGGLGRSACYVSTEGVAAVRRLHELAQRLASRLSASRKRRLGQDETAGILDSGELLDGIFVQQVYTADELVRMLVGDSGLFLSLSCVLMRVGEQQTRLPQLLEDKQTKLVVIDSIAAVFRLESTASVKVRSGIVAYEWVKPRLMSWSAGGERAVARHVPPGQLHAHPERAVRRHLCDDQPGDGRLPSAARRRQCLQACAWALVVVLHQPKVAWAAGVSDIRGRKLRGTPWFAS